MKIYQLLSSNKTGGVYYKNKFYSHQDIICKSVKIKNLITSEQRNQEKKELLKKNTITELIYSSIIGLLIVKRFNKCNYMLALFI